MIAKAIVGFLQEKGEGDDGDDEDDANDLLLLNVVDDEDEDIEGDDETTEGSFFKNLWRLRKR